MPRSRTTERREDKRARLANNIQEIRRSRGIINAETFSKEIGLGWHSLSRYEIGDTEPSVTVAILIAKKLGCTVEDLYRPYVERLPKK